MVDRLTKGRMYEPLETLGTEEVVEALSRRLFCVRGFPLEIVLDRGSAINSRIYRRILERYNVKVKMATAFHPETDGQSEAAVKGLKKYLRLYINYAQDN